jgi:hypothetical protein
MKCHIKTVSCRERNGSVKHVENMKMPIIDKEAKTILLLSPRTR